MFENTVLTAVVTLGLSAPVAEVGKQHHVGALPPTGRAATPGAAARLSTLRAMHGRGITGLGSGP